MAHREIRNCLLALDDREPLWERLLDYRFEESELEGHSVGNLLITALTRLNGDFDSAIREIDRLLRVRAGFAQPSVKLTLIATHPDGTKSTGEEGNRSFAVASRSAVWNRDPEFWNLQQPDAGGSD